MNETHLTVVGTICTALSPKRVGAEGHLRVSFRVACNERRRDRLTGDWGDGDSFYVQVNCWRRLAENVVASLVIGDPVVVTGRLYTRSWEVDGEKRSVVNLEASSVGVDLGRYRAVVVRGRERRVYDATAAEPGAQSPSPVGAAGSGAGTGLASGGEPGAEIDDPVPALAVTGADDA